MGQYPDGLRGPLIVHDPVDPYFGQYDEEIILTTTGKRYEDKQRSMQPWLISC